MSSNNTTKDIKMNQLETMNKQQLYNMIIALHYDKEMYKSHYEEEKKNYKELQDDFREERKEKQEYKKQLEDIKNILK